MTALSTSWPLMWREEGSGLRMLRRPRRWRIGPHVLEETVYRELWILGRDDVSDMDTLPRAMTDADVIRLRIRANSTVADLLATVERMVPMYRGMDRKYATDRGSTA